jgi:hypothetical protein
VKDKRKAPYYAKINNRIAPHNQRLQADVPLRVTRLSRKPLDTESLPGRTIWYLLGRR